MSEESQKLVKQALKKSGVTVSGSADIVTTLATAGKAVGSWISKPENAALVLDTGMKVGATINQGKKEGQKEIEAGKKIASSSKSQRDIEIGNILKGLGEERILVSQIRQDLLAQGIVTEQAQWEGVRNALAEKLYTMPRSVLKGNRQKKAILIFLIKNIDNALANGQTPTFSV